MSHEWDPKKAAANLRKHGVDFADAVAVLEDEAALTTVDDDPEENRFATVGMDSLARVLVVVIRGAATRFDSFRRKATPSERRQYEEEL